MYCPEHLVFQAGSGKWLRLTLWLYWRDVPRHTIPLSVWLNPLRYQLTAVSRHRRLFVLNSEGRWWDRLTWALWQKRKWERIDAARKEAPKPEPGSPT